MNPSTSKNISKQLSSYKTKKSDTDSASLLLILKKHWQTTSLRGIPRILTADTQIVRWLWIIFVSVLFFCCSYNLYKIVLLYFEYDIVQMPTLRIRPDAVFPSVTICNQVPLSSEGQRLITSLNWTTPRQFWTDVYKKATREIPKLNITEQDQTNVNYYFSSFLSRSAYWSNIPLGYDPHDLGFAQNVLIRQCFLTAKNHKGVDPPFRTPHCEHFGTWRRIQDQNRLNCYTYTVNEDVEHPVLEMEMLIYLGHDYEQCIDCLTQDVNTQIMGAKVVMHERGSYPDTHKEGFNIYPGTLTEVIFKTFNWTRMTAPYGDCSEDIPPYVNINGMNFSYTQEACFKVHVQEQVNEKCGCSLSLFPHSNFEKKLCNRLDGDINHFTVQDLFQAINRSRCGSIEMFNVEGKDVHCPKPCRYFEYESSTTQARWPRENWQIKVFKNHLKSRPIANESSKIQTLRMQIEKLLKNNTAESLLLARQILKDSRLIEESFVTLKIKKKDFVVTDVQDKPVRTLASTLSQIGGLLSMWMGMTFIFIVELLELTIRIFSYCFMRLNEPKQYRKTCDDDNDNHVHQNSNNCIGSEVVWTKPDSDTVSNEKQVTFSSV